MPNVLFNGMPREEFFNGRITYGGIKITIENILLLSTDEAKELSEFIGNVPEMKAKIENTKTPFKGNILKKMEGKVQAHECNLRLHIPNHKQFN